jgi:hypothetical protein
MKIRQDLTIFLETHSVIHPLVPDDAAGCAYSRAKNQQLLRDYGLGLGVNRPSAHGRFRPYGL